MARVPKQVLRKVLVTDAAVVSWRATSFSRSRNTTTDVTVLAVLQRVAML